MLGKESMINGPFLRSKENTEGRGRLFGGLVLDLCFAL